MTYTESPATKAGIALQAGVLANKDDVFEVARNIIDLPQERFIERYFRLCVEYGAIIDKSVLNVSTAEEFYMWRIMFVGGLLLDASEREVDEISGEWITFAQAQRALGVSEGAIRKARLDGRFNDDEIRKEGKSWEMRVTAFNRLWGASNKKEEN